MITSLVLRNHFNSYIIYIYYTYLCIEEFIKKVTCPGTYHDSQTPVASYYLTSLRWALPCINGLTLLTYMNNNKNDDNEFMFALSFNLYSSGKARKGDGNDLTPNPRKLHVIGKELDNLGKVINDMIPVSELPFNIRPKTRKEKNKLASRACRLKKKAQHEANKIKLYGLQQEHSE